MLPQICSRCSPSSVVGPTSLHCATDFIHHNNVSGLWPASVESRLISVKREASIIEINVFQCPQASERLPLTLGVSQRPRVAADGCSTPAQMKQSKEERHSGLIQAQVGQCKRGVGFGELLLDEP